MSGMLTLEQWRERAERQTYKTRAFIDGRYVDAASGKTFAVTCPSTGKLLTEVAECDSEDVDRAVAAARRSFESGDWSMMAKKDRKAVLLRFADLIDENMEELALIETLDCGKPISFSVKKDITGTAIMIRWFAEAIDKINDEIVPSRSDAIAMVTREPMGVVAAVVPWNYPMYLGYGAKVGPALAAGNSVILKPAEQTPLSAIWAAELASQAGIPDGVFNVLPGFGETAGQALGRHMDVDCVTFTGSGEIGKLFMKYSGESNMKRISLECGGKSPQVVLADCDLDLAGAVVAKGIFYNQGEVCNAGSRVIVEAPVKDALVERVIEHSKMYMPHDPLDPTTEMGAIVDAVQLKRITDYVEIGKQEGAELVLGGARVMEETGGFYFPPTVFDKVDNDMRLAREEIFGPVLSVITCDGFDEGIRIANDSDFGLTGSVWTKDIDKAHKAARALRCGVVWINEYNVSEMSTPFGGYKQSGFGRDKSLHALDKYCELKCTWIQLHDQ